MVPLGSITVEASRDPDDNRVIETAILGGAAAIVTGDRDLLDSGSYEGVEIMRPADWIERRSARS